MVAVFFIILVKARYILYEGDAMKSSLLEKETLIENSAEYEEWINSFSGLGGKDSIRTGEPNRKVFNISKIVKISRSPIGE